MAMDPESAEISVERMRTIVVLPAPFGPSRARIVPSSAVRFTRSSTRWLPKDLHTSLATIPDEQLWPVIALGLPRGDGLPLAGPPPVPSTAARVRGVGDAPGPARCRCRLGER